MINMDGFGAAWAVLSGIKENAVDNHHNLGSRHRMQYE